MPKCGKFFGESAGRSVLVHDDHFPRQARLAGEARQHAPQFRRPSEGGNDYSDSVGILVQREEVSGPCGFGLTRQRIPAFAGMR